MYCDNYHVLFHYFKSSVSQSVSAIFIMFQWQYLAFRYSYIFKSSNLLDKLVTETKIKMQTNIKMNIRHIQDVPEVMVPPRCINFYISTFALPFNSFVFCNFLNGQIVCYFVCCIKSEFRVNLL